MEEAIQIQFNTDLSSLRKAIDDVKSEMKKLSDENKKLSEDDKRRVDALKEQLKVYQEQEKALLKVKVQSQQIGTSLARIVQDLPFGIVGIGNNITFLSEQLENVQRNAKLAGQSIGAFQLIGQGIVQLFTSPSGLISLFVTLATVFKEVFTPAINAVSSAFTKLTDNLGLTDSKFNNFLEKYKERVNELVKVNKQKPDPFLPSTKTEIEEKVKEYEKTIKELDRLITERQRKKVTPIGEEYSPINYLYRELLTLSDDEIKKLKQRREVLLVELNALKDALVEFQVQEKKTLSLNERGVVEVGKPFIKRQVIPTETQKVSPPVITAETVNKRLITLRPELQPIENISSLNIASLELAVERLTQKIKSGDTSLVPKLKAFKRELDKKMIEAGLKESRTGKSDETSFIPDFLPFNTKTLEQVRKEEEKERQRLNSLVRPVGLVEEQVSETEKSFLRQQGAIARASQLFSLAKEASSLGQTDVAERLMQDAEAILAKAGISDLGIGSFNRSQLLLQNQNVQFGVGLASTISSSLSQLFTLQDALLEREREVGLERIALAKRDNARLEEEMRQSYRRRISDVERLLQEQQITEEEALARKKELENSKIQEEENFALRRKELALQEEQLLKGNSNTVLKQTLANASNFAIQFVFKALANDPVLSSLGVFGVITGAILAPILIAGLQSVIEKNIRSFASGGIVKEPTLAIVGDAKRSNNKTNEEVIFNERLLVKQAERFASMVNSPVIVINGRKMNEELLRSERVNQIVTIR